MAETRTIARPYARAAFQLASGQGRLAEWSDAIAALSELASHDELSALIGNPKVPAEKLTGIVLEACGDRLDEPGRNLVALLIENGRLSAAPAIAEQFEQLRAEAENRVDVTVTAAAKIEDSDRDALAQALQSRLGRNVNIEVETNPELIGGAVVRAGDLVIDGSVRGELERMSQALTN